MSLKWMKSKLTNVSMFDFSKTDIGVSIWLARANSFAQTG